jgi:polyphosphate kinase
VSEIFNYLTGYSQRADFNHMLVAPVSLRLRFVEMLQREMAHVQAGRPAHVIIKNNAVTDPAIVRALYSAAQAGVEIDMIVRGVCCLRPGIDGISQRIRVRSVVGRFLEHSRVYYFANGGQPEMYLGSADLMERNLDRRVETLCRVRSARIVGHLRDVVLDAYLRDTDRAYVLADGRYVRTSPAPGEPRVSAQQQLLDRYTPTRPSPDDTSEFGENGSTSLS